MKRLLLASLICVVAIVAGRRRCWDVETHGEGERVERIAWIGTRMETGTGFHAEVTLKRGVWNIRARG
jgi:hypothetical protein